MSRQSLSGFSSESFSIAGFVEHMGVFYATTIWLWASFTTLSPYVSCIGQAACSAFDKGNAMGSGTAKFKGTCRDRGALRLCCGLRKPPGALVPFFCSHAVCRIFVGNYLGKP